MWYFVQGALGHEHTASCRRQPAHRRSACSNPGDVSVGPSEPPRREGGKRADIRTGCNLCECRDVGTGPCSASFLLPTPPLAERPLSSLPCWCANVSPSSMPHAAHRLRTLIYASHVGKPDRQRWPTAPRVSPISLTKAVRALPRCSRHHDIVPLRLSILGFHGAFRTGCPWRRHLSVSR